jgi:hypothetical protein
MLAAAEKSPWRATEIFVTLGYYTNATVTTDFAIHLKIYFSSPFLALFRFSIILSTKNLRKMLYLIVSQVELDCGSSLT